MVPLIFVISRNFNSLTTRIRLDIIKLTQSIPKISNDHVKPSCYGMMAWIYLNHNLSSCLENY